MSPRDRIDARGFASSHLTGGASPRFRFTPSDDARDMAKLDRTLRTFARRALAVHAAASLALAVAALGVIAWRSAPSLRQGSPQEAFAALGGVGGAQEPPPTFYGLLWPFSGQLDARPSPSERNNGQR